MVKSGDALLIVSEMSKGRAMADTEKIYPLTQEEVVDLCNGINDDAAAMLRDSHEVLRHQLHEAQKRVALLSDAIAKVLPPLAKEFMYLAVERNYDGDDPVRENWIVRTLREALGKNA